MFTRRKFAKILGGTPLGLAALGASSPDNQVPAPTGWNLPDLRNKAKPLMSNRDAKKILLGQKKVREELESALYQKYRDVDHIDADIDVHKSFSRMAKIAFQRQRNVAQDMVLAAENDTYHITIDRIMNEMVAKLMWGS